MLYLIHECLLWILLQKNDHIIKRFSCTFIWFAMMKWCLTVITSVPYVTIEPSGWDRICQFVVIILHRSSVTRDCITGTLRGANHGTHFTTEFVPLYQIPPKIMGSYGASIVRIWEKIIHVIMALHCILFFGYFVCWMLQSNLIITVCCIMILNKAWQVQDVDQTMNCERTPSTLSSSVFCEYFAEKWPHYNEVQLYLYMLSSDNVVSNGYCLSAIPHHWAQWLRQYLPVCGHWSS